MKCLLIFLLVHLVATTVNSQLECPENKDASVLILGGGMAGISAANRLSELGINDFVILEAQDRLGGRMRTEEIAPGVNVSVGAIWIHGVDSLEPRRHPIFDLAVRCGIEGSYTDYDDIITYDENGTEISDSELRYDDFETAQDAAYKLAGELPDNSSVRTALTQSGWTPVNPNDNFVEWYLFDFCIGEPPERTSLQTYDADETYSFFLADPNNTAADWTVTDNRGTAYLVECLASNFSNNPSTDERIHLGTLVTRVEYGDSCVCATVMENGEQRRYCGDYAIVTFSIGVLKNQSSTLFSPPLPTNKTEALNLLSISFYYIIFAQFSNRFWDNTQFIGHVSPERGYLPFIQGVPESRGVNATAFHLADEIAFRLQSMTDEEQRTEIGNLMRTLYGDKATMPTNVLSMRWGQNDLFLGSYSNARPGGSGGFAELAKPEGNLYFAGEGTSTMFNGYIHGAYFSGRDAADAIEGRRSAGDRMMENTLLLLAIAACNVLLCF